jgi:predicted ABC-type sugar transport system permease subunit
VLLVLGNLVGNAIARLVFSVGPEWPYWPLFTVVVGSHALVLGALMLAARAWQPLQPLYHSLRRDWTRLSFGLFVLVSFLFGAIDHEEDPRLTLFVLLPPLIVALGALVCLRNTNKAQRILAMLIGLVLAVGLRALGGKPFYGEYAMQLAAIIFLPALLALLPPPNRSRTAPAEPVET